MLVVDLGPALSEKAIDLFQLLSKLLVSSRVLPTARERLLHLPLLMPEFGLISQSAAQDRVQLPETGVDRLERALAGITEAERVTELPAWQAQKSFDRIVESFNPRGLPPREDLEATVRTEEVGFDAHQRLDLAAELLQMLARLRPFIEAYPMIVSERMPELDGEGFAAVVFMPVSNGDGLLVRGHAQTGFMRFLRERLQLPLQIAAAVAPDRVEAREAGEFDFDGDLFQDLRVAGGDGLDLRGGDHHVVHVFRGARGHVTRHDLGDEAGLALEGLPYIYIEGLFGDVIEDTHLGESIQ